MLQTRLRSSNAALGSPTHPIDAMNTSTERTSRGPMPPVLLFVALVSMAALHLALPVGELFTSFWRLIVGGCLLGAGIAVNFWADKLFKEKGTSVKPLEPSTELVTNGPFAFTRHPMYLGMLFILGGVALCFGSLSPWFVVPAFFWQITRRFVRPEEDKLDATFGDRYRDYKRKVRRWL